MATKTDRSIPYTRTNPVLTCIKERYSLCGPNSKKETTHLALDLTGIDFPYEVGDSVGIYCPNDDDIVAKTLEAMRLTGEETVISRRTEESMSFLEFLRRKASITEFSKKFLQEIAARQTDEKKKNLFEELFADRTALKAYIAEREVWDLLLEHPQVTFSAQEYCDLLMPNLPRLYSIASSQYAFPDEVHLTIGLTTYETNGHRRYGVASHYLCNIAPIGEQVLPIYLHPHTGFTLPEDKSRAIIMVGPGTGIAPFRAFMQERIATEADGKNWLFFGEWTRRNEFFYEDDWKNLEMQGTLKLDTAFSRDQQDKIYVQHRMMERAEELWQWLEEGAFFYVCGDKDHMARDVDQALHQIALEQGGMDEEEAKRYVKNLRLQKRYLRDVY